MLLSKKRLLSVLTSIILTSTSILIPSYATSKSPPDTSNISNSTVKLNDTSSNQSQTNKPKRIRLKLSNDSQKEISKKDTSKNIDNNQNKEKPENKEEPLPRFRSAPIPSLENFKAPTMNLMAFQDNTIDIPDPEFYKNIKFALHLRRNESLTTQKANSITSLFLNGKIRSFHGIKYFKNLEDLTIYFNAPINGQDIDGLEEIGELKNLKNIKFVNESNNSYYIDFSFLNNNTNLVKLTFQNLINENNDFFNKLQDIKNIETLSLDYNNIKSLKNIVSFINRQNNFRQLILIGNTFEDFSPIFNINNLSRKSIYIKNNLYIYKSSKGKFENPIKDAYGNNVKLNTSNAQILSNPPNNNLSNFIKNLSNINYVQTTISNDNKYIEIPNFDKNYKQYDTIAIPYNVTNQIPGDRYRNLKYEGYLVVVKDNNPENTNQTESNPSNVSSINTIDIPDPAFETAVRNQLKISKNTPLTKELARSLKQLGIPESVDSLDGLKYFTNVEDLVIQIDFKNRTRPPKHMDQIGNLKRLCTLAILNSDPNYMPVQDINSNLAIDFSFLDQTPYVFLLMLKGVIFDNGKSLSELNNLKTIKTLDLSNNNINTLDYIVPFIKKQSYDGSYPAFIKNNKYFKEDTIFVLLTQNAIGDFSKIDNLKEQLDSDNPLLIILILNNIYKCNINSGKIKNPLKEIKGEYGSISGINARIFKTTPEYNFNNMFENITVDEIYNHKVTVSPNYEYIEISDFDKLENGNTILIQYDYEKEHQYGFIQKYDNMEWGTRPHDVKYSGYLVLVKEDKNTQIPSDNHAKSIKINQDNLSIEVDKQIKLSAVLSPQNSTDTIKWNIVNGFEFAKIDSNGNVTALKPGIATIRAYTSDNVKDEIKIKIVPKPSKPDDKIVKFKDPKFEEIIKTELNIPKNEPISKDKALKVDKLFIYGQFDSVEGIQNFENLKILSLNKEMTNTNDIPEDLDAIGQLKYLKDFKIHNNKSILFQNNKLNIDFSFLNNNANLNNISLSGVLSGDMKFFKNLTNLKKVETIDIRENNIEDVQNLIDFINHQNNFKILDFSRNSWGDFSDFLKIKKLNNLKYPFDLIQFSLSKNICRKNLEQNTIKNPIKDIHGKYINLDTANAQIFTNELDYTLYDILSKTTKPIKGHKISLKNDNITISDFDNLSKGNTVVIPYKYKKSYLVEDVYNIEYDGYLVLVKNADKVTPNPKDEKINLLLEDKHLCVGDKIYGCFYLTKNNSNTFESISPNDSKLNISIDDPSIVEYKDGYFYFKNIGKTSINISYDNNYASYNVDVSTQRNKIKFTVDDYNRQTVRYLDRSLPYLFIGRFSKFPIKEKYFDHWEVSGIDDKSNLNLDSYVLNTNSLSSYDKKNASTVNFKAVYKDTQRETISLNKGETKKLNVLDEYPTNNYKYVIKVLDKNKIQINGNKIKALENGETSLIIYKEEEEKNNIVYIANIKISENKEQIKIKGGDFELEKGESKSLSIDKNVKVKWTCSDKNIISIDDNGNVKALAEGKSTITASTEDGEKDSITVTVKPFIIKIKGGDFELEKGESKSLSIDKNVKVKWTCSDKNIISIDDNGNVKALAKGKSTITASTEDGEKDSITVTVKPFIIKIKGGDFELEKGDSKSLSIDKNVKVKWTCSDKNIISIDDNGNVKALAKGKSTITASTEDGEKDSITVTVKPFTIKIKGGNIEIDKGDSKYLSIIPDIDANWKSSDEKIATIDNKGKLKAIAIGKVTITATATKDGNTATNSIQVTVKEPRHYSGGGGGSSYNSSSEKSSKVDRALKAERIKTLVDAIDGKISDKDKKTIPDKDKKVEDSTKNKVDENKEISTGNVTDENIENSTGNVTDEKVRENIKEYKDIKQNSWYTKSISYVKEKKLMTGTSKNKFSPNKNTDRNMVVKILYNLSGDKSTQNTNKFKDVKDNKWYTSAVNWATKNKIASGFKDNTFRGSQDISREQLITMLYNYTKFKGYDVNTKEHIENSYKDFNKISSYAKVPMEWGLEKGIIKGKNNMYISPKDKATRAELASILERFIKSYNL